VIKKNGKWELIESSKRKKPKNSNFTISAEEKGKDTLLQAYESDAIREVAAQSEDLIKHIDYAGERRAFPYYGYAIPQLAWIAHPDGYIYWYNERWYSIPVPHLSRRKVGLAECS